MKKKVIQVSEKDNVVVVVEAVEKGTEICLPDGSSLVTLDDIPRSHKVAIQDIPEGGQVLRYGEIIGYATKPIQRGQWVHTHNLDSLKMM